MALIVQKFGGTSMRGPDRIKNVARRAVATHRAGNQVVVVVSAMAGETDRLLQLAAEISARPSDREIDVLLATGEQVSIALLALAICELGVQARSLLGHQVQIRTDSVHGSARIRTIEAQPVTEALALGEIVVVAGFQGVDEHGNITTLGRGGSDLSAVAMAAALHADACEIYSDVDGIYTTDPNIYHKARKLARINCEEMLEMASLGAKVLQTRSVEFALKHKVALHCRSSFTEAEGSWVMPEPLDMQGVNVISMEGIAVTGVTIDAKTAKLTVKGIRDVPGAVAKLFAPLAEHQINVDVIIQNPPTNGLTDVSFTVPSNVADQALALTQGLQTVLGFQAITIDKNVAKVSVVGAADAHAARCGVAHFCRVRRCWHQHSLISTSEIKISCVIEASLTAKAVQVLHDAFALELPQG